MTVSATHLSAYASVAAPSSGTMTPGDPMNSSRREWIAKGMPWFGPAKPQLGCDPVQQLRSLTNPNELTERTGGI